MAICLEHEGYDTQGAYRICVRSIGLPTNLLRGEVFVCPTAVRGPNASLCKSVLPFAEAVHVAEILSFDLATLTR